VVPRLKRELNAFLATWLRNLKAQGHRLVRDTGWSPERVEGVPVRSRCIRLPVRGVAGLTRSPTPHATLCVGLVDELSW